MKQKIVNVAKKLAISILEKSGYRFDNGIGLLSPANHNFMKEEGFVKGRKAAIYQHTPEGGNLHYGDYVLHIHQWATKTASKLEGDFVECGTYCGAIAISNIVANDLDKTNNKYYLFDTYDGLDETLATEEEMVVDNPDFSSPKVWQLVQETFSKYPNVIPIKGSVPESLKQVKIDKVAYLHLDMNCEAPETAAINYFWDKMVTGGIVLLDDYGHNKHWRQKVAMDKFFKSVGSQVLSLPTGQGLIIKS